MSDIKEEVKSHWQLGLITTCVALSLACVYPTEVMIMATYRKCETLSVDRTSEAGTFKQVAPQNCKPYFGRKTDAEGHTWDISLLENCVSLGLAAEYPDWKINDTTTVKFWSSSEKSAFNVFDYQSMPAFMLETKKYKAFNSLGYAPKDISGFKEVPVAGAREALYHRQPMYLASWGLFVMVPMFMLCVKLSSDDSVIPEKWWRMATYMTVILFLIFSTFSLFSTFYGYTYLMGARSPFPTNPAEASRDPFNGDYELIKMDQLQFQLDPNRCPRTIMEELNRDMGEFYYNSAGIHGKTFYWLLLTGIVFYFLPLVIMLLKSGDGESSNQDKQAMESRMRVVVLVAIVVVGSLGIAITASDNYNHRCGDRSPDMISGLGAFYGNHVRSTQRLTLEYIVQAIVVTVALAGLGMEGYEKCMSSESSTAGSDSFYASLKEFLTSFNVAVALCIFSVLVEALIVANYVAINATDLCDPTLKPAGRALSTAIFMLTMVLIIAYSSVRSYQVMMQGGKGKSSGSTAAKMGSFMRYTKVPGDLGMTMI